MTIHYTAAQNWTDWKPGVHPSAPMSNTERQRRFRERNPGYYKRLHRKRRAAVAALSAAKKAERAAHAAWQAEISRVPLMLPAPDQVSKPSVLELLRGLETPAAAREAVG